MADGVILVVAADRTPREDVIEAIDRLRATGGRLLGAVLMDARLDNARKEASR
jgi:Mrp family chromosome partitioning ATPase